MADRPKPPPRLPSLASARKLVQEAWLNPTEQGLQDTRRSLVRRMWQTRRIQRWKPGKGQHALSPHHLHQAATVRSGLRALYHLVCQRQAQRDWEISDAERRSRHRNRNNPAQYDRESVQRHRGTTALLTLNLPAHPSDHAYQPAIDSAPIIIHQGTGPTEETRILTPRYRNRRMQSLHRFAVHHLARQLFLAHYRGWQGLNLTPSYGTPSEEPRPASKGAVPFSGTLFIEGVVIRADTFITSTEYQRALNRLSPAHQSEIQSYYRRSPAKGDVAPEIENWTYQNTVQAFDALLHALYDQGSVSANASACVSSKNHAE